MSEIASEPEVVGERVALDAAGTAELVEDEDLAPGETYKDLGNVRADELATRAM